MERPSTGTALASSDYKIDGAHRQGLQPEPHSPAVALTGVTQRFGDFEAVRNLTFSIARGTICGLLAPSGGGKTTTLRLITGAYTPSEGTVHVLGGAPDRFTADDRRRMGYMPQQFVLYPELSVRRNLKFMAGIYGLPLRGRGRRINELISMVELDEAKSRRAGKLSGGMQRRLQLAATLLHRPELLVIDEPTAGIDPILRARFWDYFRRLREEGRTLIISTQYVTEAEFCDQLVVLRRGALVGVGTPKELRDQAFGPDYVNPDGEPPSFEDVFLRLMIQAERREAQTPEEGLSNRQGEGGGR
ncbi:MAG: ABC transporter ATP-binding protein [Dehalococcoidia bacterium]